MEKIRKPRGTMDIFSPESDIWVYVEEKMREVARRFGFTEVRTPTFEEIGLFKRGVGDTTDVVQKEMYAFEDKDGSVFALRPEGTASVVRAIIENGKTSDPMPLKYYYIINCFRYEKPQAGRSREFSQFGIEMFGASGAAADFTSISLANALLRELGIQGIKLHINSIGCPECRPAYREKLIEYLNERRDSLCDTCKERLEMNPLRVLDCKNDECRKIAEGAPKSVDNLCTECKAHMDTLINMLDSCGIDYVIDTKIVRGLDYYTKTVFEFICDGIGAQSTVCGGGRYDGLMEQLGGPSLPGIGFGMGITRLIMAMKQSGAYLPEREPLSLYVAPLGDRASIESQRIVTELRDAGVRAECDIMNRSLKAQMKYADKLGARYALIIGDSELESGVAVIKNMQTSEQTEIKISDAADFIRKSM